MTESEAAHYLAGMFDGEGHVSILYGGVAWPSDSRTVRISNTNLGLIEACAECCDLLGIKYTRTKQAAKNTKGGVIFCLNIYSREAIERFATLVPIRHADKIEKFKEVTSTYRRQRKSVA